MGERAQSRWAFITSRETTVRPFGLLWVWDTRVSCIYGTYAYIYTYVSGMDQKGNTKGNHRRRRKKKYYCSNLHRSENTRDSGADISFWACLGMKIMRVTDWLTHRAADFTCCFYLCREYIPLAYYGMCVHVYIHVYRPSVGLSKVTDVIHAPSSKITAWSWRRATHIDNVIT